MSSSEHVKVQSDYKSEYITCSDRHMKPCYVIDVAFAKKLLLFIE